MNGVERIAIRCQTLLNGPDHCLTHNSLSLSMKRQERNAVANGLELNQDEEFVENIRKRVRDNGGYCLYEEKNNKANKCPKPCKRSGECMCGLYISNNWSEDDG